MILENLSKSLKNILKNITKTLFIDKKTIQNLTKEIQKALLYSDVDVNLVLHLTEKIKKRALKEKTKLSKKEHIIKIIYQELTKLFGKEKQINITKKPYKIMLIGLLGSGKTTFTVKLANYYQKKGYKTATLGLDTHRPAAFEQLKKLSQQANIPCLIKKYKDPIKIYQEFKAPLKKYDIIIIDTAGRNALDKKLIKELKNLNQKIKPDQTFLIIPAEIGQAAKEQTQEFHKNCKISGVILTKLDGTARGGGALTATATTSSPIIFIGTGEKINDIEKFEPKTFTSRLLGMPDIKTLLEKIQISIEKPEQLIKKPPQEKFNLLDLHQQLESIKKLGSFSKIIDLIPGLSNIKIQKNTLQIQEQKLRHWRFILDSMTKQELENPEIIDQSRIERIAKGSGTTTTEIRELLKQYKQSKKLLKLTKSPREIEKLMKKIKNLKINV